MSDDHDDVAVDCLIIGGGPAGLTAAIYLARFHLSVMVIDMGTSRCALIPLTHNLAGFPDGISGIDLLARMRLQAERYGATFRDGRVTALARGDGGEDENLFLASTTTGAVRARTVLLATGVINRRPEMFDDDEAHDRALAAGLLRYCPICDGFEATDQRIAVLGTGERGCAEALFVRSYSRDVTLVAPAGAHELSVGERQSLDEAGVTIAGPCERITVANPSIVLTIDDRQVEFDTLYPALGSDIRSELAAQVGAHRSGEGCLTVDAHQRTDIAGLYAAGDVVLGLDQISHAMGEGGVAATTIRNDLAERSPLRR